MIQKRYVISLTPSQKTLLVQLIQQSETAESQIARATILLKSDINQQEERWTERQISDLLDISCTTIEKVKQKFVEEGLKSALNWRSRKSCSIRIDKQKKLYSVVVACSETPTGKGYWMLQFLPDRKVELKYIEPVSTNSIGQTTLVTS